MIRSLRERLAPHRQRAREWGKILVFTTGIQVGIQVVGFASGLIMIRRLSLKEYAFYTIGNMMLGTMTILADGGISNGVSAAGGRVWKDRAKLGGIVTAGLKLRRSFAVGSLAVAGPAMILILRHNGASWTQCMLLLAALIPAFLAALSDTLYELPPKLGQDLVPLQRNQLFAAVSRLACTVALVLSWPVAAAGLFASGISRSAANLRLRKIADKHADLAAPPDPEAREKIIQVVRRELPSSIYYCVSGQLSIWLLSLFGSTEGVGQIGALNGLSTALNLFSMVFLILAVPRFARLADQKGLLFRRFLLLQCALLLLGLVIVAGVALFSTPLLSILGNKFTGLRYELILVATQACITLTSQSTNQMLSARGILVPPSVFIFGSIASQVLFAFLIPLHSVSGLLWYGIATSILVYLMRLVYFGIFLSNHQPAPMNQ